MVVGDTGSARFVQECIENDCLAGTIFTIKHRKQAFPLMRIRHIPPVFVGWRIILWTGSALGNQTVPKSGAHS